MNTVVNCALLMLAALIAGQQAAVEALQGSEGACKIECYPNTKMINGKGAGKNENCRWIMRTDGKPARLCDHITCKKICHGNRAQLDHLEGASSNDNNNNLRIEQQLGDENGAPLDSEPMGIMRHLHGSKMAKAPVPGLAPNQRVSSPALAPAPASSSVGVRRMAPTLPPSVQYDENDTPPPISRFLDISPEE